MKSKISYIIYGFLLANAIIFIFTKSDTYIAREFSITKYSKYEEGADSKEKSDNIIINEDEASDYDYYYNDGSVRIAITDVNDRNNNQIYHVADVTISSVEQFVSLFAYGIYSSNSRQGTSAMAETAGAVFAVSGDFFNQRKTGVIIRNGILYRNTTTKKDMLTVDSNGDFSIIPAGENPDGNELINQGILQAYVFGPAIVEEGKAVKNVRETSDYVSKSHPRMLIGQLDTLHYLFVAVDGRKEDASGMTIYECGELMEKLGCTVAYNLDGGGSSTMVFKGEILNTPSQGSERAISDCIGILGEKYGN